MLHGDISNRQCPIIAFNVDNLLFRDEEKKGLINSIVNRFSSEKSKYLAREINKDFKRDLDILWNDYEYSLYLITQQPYTKELEEILGENNICYTSLEYFEDLEELRDITNRQYTYYFDTDETTLSFLSSTGALHYDLLWKRVKGN